MSTPEIKNNIDNNEFSIKEWINKKLDKLNNPEYSLPVNLEKIKNLYSWLDNNKTNNLLSAINKIVSNDEWVNKKWDFLNTLDNLKIG